VLLCQAPEQLQFGLVQSAHALWFSKWVTLISLQQVPEKLVLSRKLNPNFHGLFFTKVG
jgi:hypothetical protein